MLSFQHSGPVFCPACSPDLSLLDIFIWGHLRRLNYKTPIEQDGDLYIIHVPIYDGHMVFLSKHDSQWCIAACCAMKLVVITLNSCCSSSSGSCGNAEMHCHHHTVSLLPLRY
jgi:hypothetical protein